MTATLLLTSPASAPPRDMRSFLLIRPGGIGDAVLLVPVIHAIRKQFPSAKITVLVERRNASVFRLCPDADRVLLYDRPSDLIDVASTNFNIVIDTEQWHRLSAVVARLTKAAMLVGFATNERARLFTHRVPYSHNDYEAESFFNLLAPLGVSRQLAFHTPFLTVPEAARLRSAELLSTLVGRVFVAVFPGATISERRWGAARFRQLTERLSHLRFPVVVVGGKEDFEEGESIVSGDYGLNLVGKTSLAETAAVIEKAVVLVSGDSGILHIGVGLGKPTVSLFGPGIAKKWAPRGDRHIVINKHLPCSPCTKFGHTPKCPINAKCMSDITVDEVVTAVEKLLFEQVRSEG